MMKFLHPIILVLSFVLMLTAGMTLTPDLLAISESGRVLDAFLLTGALCLFLSALGFAATAGRSFQVSSMQLYLITVSSWCVFATVGAAPFFSHCPK